MLRKRFLEDTESKIVLKRKHLTITLSKINGDLDIDVFNIVNRKRYLCKITKSNENKYLSSGKSTSLFDVVKNCIEKGNFACYILREPSAVDESLEEFMLIRIRVRDEKSRAKKRKRKVKSKDPNEKFFWFVLRLRTENDDEDVKPILKEDLQPYSKVLKRVRFKIPKQKQNLNFSSSSDCSSTTSSTDPENGYNDVFEPRKATNPRKGQPMMYPLLDNLQESSSEEDDLGRNSTLFELDDNITFGNEEDFEDDYHDYCQNGENEFNFRFDSRTHTDNKKNKVENNRRQSRLRIRVPTPLSDRYVGRSAEEEEEEELLGLSNIDCTSKEKKDEVRLSTSLRDTEFHSRIQICDIQNIPSSNRESEKRLSDLIKEAEELVGSAEVTLTELKKGLFVM